MQRSPLPVIGHRTESDNKLLHGDQTKRSFLHSRALLSHRHPQILVQVGDVGCTDISTLQAHVEQTVTSP